MMVALRHIHWFFIFSIKHLQKHSTKDTIYGFIKPERHDMSLLFLFSRSGGVPKKHLSSHLDCQLFSALAEVFP